MKNEKSFELKNIEDYQYYLFNLITKVSYRMGLFKRYIKELEEIVNKNKEVIKNNEDLPIELYQDSKDKIGFTRNTLFNLFGDLTPTATSYYKFRKHLDEQINTNPKFKGVQKLNEEFTKQLKDYNQHRNWALHVPDSLLIAAHNLLLEDAKKKGLIFFPNPNPIKLLNYTEVEGQLLLGLYISSEESYKEMQKLFQQMKRDYSQLIGESVELISISMPHPYDTKESRDADVANMSWNIQTGKYRRKNKEKSQL